MDNSTPIHDLLMRYLDGEMTGAEKEEFETRLSSDKELRAELDDLRMASAAVKAYGLKQNIATVHRQMMKELKPQAVVREMSTTRRVVQYSLAAAATLGLIMISIIGYQFLTLSPDKLYNSKYSSFELSSLRGENYQLAAVENAYREKNYAAVIDLSKKNPAPGIKDEFITAISYMELNRPEDAVALFSDVIKQDKNSPNPVFKDEAEYYLALCYLKTKDYKKALELMEAIHASPDHLYRQKFSQGFIRKVRMLKWR